MNEAARPAQAAPLRGFDLPTALHLLGSPFSKGTMGFPSGDDAGGRWEELCMPGDSKGAETVLEKKPGSFSLSLPPE